MNNRFKQGNWATQNLRLIFLIIYVIIFVSLSCFIIYKGQDMVKSKKIDYTNNSTIDYFVYLKENNYFDKPYLNKGEKYIASLIDKIRIEYNYNLSSAEEMTGDYKYNLVATLIITESGKDSILWKNDYNLSTPQTISFNNQKTIEINDDVEINYDYYNSVVSSFKKDYGVAIDANLLVKLVTDTNIDYNNEKYNIKKEPLVNIPLSEQTLEIDISIDENDINTNTFTYVDNPRLHYVLIALGIVFLIIYIIVGIRIIFMLINSIKNQNKYEVRLRKIFSDYDQIITSVTKLPDLKKIDVLNVLSFEELVDAQNELHKPIIFTEVKKGKEAVFLIIDDKHGYRYKILAGDNAK